MTATDQPPRRVPRAFNPARQRSIVLTFPSVEQAERFDRKETSMAEIVILLMAAVGEDPGIVDRPLPFPGTREERLANAATHAWRIGPDGGYCHDCGCEMGEVCAQWPCGMDPSREVVITDGP